MLRGEGGLAFLRVCTGLWLLGGLFVAFLRDENGPNSVGAIFLWHFCECLMTPCDLLGEVFSWWHFCDEGLTSPVGNCDQGIAASCQCPR